MALTKPIIGDVVAFDATVGTTVTFNATTTSGNTIEGNEIEIMTNPNDSDGSVIYTHTVMQRTLSHTIPSNTSLTHLANGSYYKLRIRTIDDLSNYSEWSDYIPFYCYSTPTVQFTNVSSGQIIRATSFTFNLTYVQTQNENINYAIINLYNANNSLIDSSGNLYNTNNPPLEFNYSVNGLQNHTNYKIKAIVETIEGTIVETPLISFSVNYETVDNDNKLIATVNNCEGYINVRSNVINKMDIESNPDPLPYIDNDTMADMTNTISDLTLQNIDEITHLSPLVTWARWGKLDIPKSFLLRAWFCPARQPFECIRLSRAEYGVLGTSYLQIKLQRGATTDYLSITTSEGVHIDRALNTFCNGNTKVFLWMKVLGNTWDVRTEVIDTDATSINWVSAGSSAVGDSNIRYNVTTDMTWGSEPHGSYVPSADVTASLSNNFVSVVAANGIFDELNITTDTSLIYTNQIPDMTPQTLLKVDFNGNIGSASDYTRLLLKRKDYTTSTWLNLVDINNIPYGSPVYINFDDSFIPSDVEQTYGLVTYVGGVPSDTYTITVTPKWAKYFISDKENKFVLNYAVIYSNHNQNIQNGVLMPIGANYPIVIQNAKGNYRSGSLQFKVLGYQYEIDKRLSRPSIIKQTDDILQFLTNGKAKCITDFNGNIFIIKVINSPQISYDANWGNGITTISFDWVEQGKYNNSSDMIGLGLFDYVAAE